MDRYRELLKKVEESFTKYLFKVNGDNEKNAIESLAYHLENS
jgi:hypothetical protein